MTQHDDDIDHKPMPLAEHLIELRNRLLYTVGTIMIMFVLSYLIADDIYRFLAQPLADILSEQGRRMIFTGLTEAFLTNITIAFWTAIFLSFPIIAIQVWLFIAPGLYRHEKRVFFPFLILTPGLFFMGGALAYYVIFPLAWQFFLSFETHGLDSLPIQLEARVGEYLSLVMSLIFAFGLCFQLPVFLSLLAYAGLISTATLTRKRKYAIIIAFISAAIITPPDVISQICLALSIIFLYEVSIYVVWLIDYNRHKTSGSKDQESSS